MNKIASLDPKAFRLIYWPAIPGRGEPIRLAFEQAGVPYVDVALEENAVEEVLAICSEDFHCPLGNPAPFAAPVLVHDNLILSQLPSIMLYLGPILDLVPKEEVEGKEINRIRVNQLFLTACDLQNEVHDSHHPIAVMDYYEDQKVEAHRRSIDLRKNRLPKFLGYFERLLPNLSSPYLVASTLSYVDLMLFNIVEGLKFAYPNASKRLLPEYPGLQALAKTVGDLPRIKNYLASERRAPFGDGLFRHYPELDVEKDLELEKK
ncbi:glutathione S-transferase [Mrakia frigida]|uniref:glutathione S-transferase n=1 Tax=Mrakia frigida TaxID=29902 RepID=UPI003FCC0953